MHVFIQSVENFGTRKKRKENMRKAIDVKTKRRKTLKTFDLFIHVLRFFTEFGHFSAKIGWNFIGVSRKFAEND